MSPPRPHHVHEAGEAGGDHAGLVDPHRLARGQTQDQVAHGDAMVAVGLDQRAAARGFAGPVDDEAFRLLLDVDAAGLETGRHQGDSVTLLDPHLAHAAHHRIAGGEGGRHGQDRIFVDHAGRAARRHDHAAKGRMPGRDVSDLLAARVATVRDGQVRAHLAQGVEKACAQRVEHHALHRHLRTGGDQGRDDREGGAGRVGRDRHLASGQDRARLQGHDAAIVVIDDGELGAEGPQHPLGVVAGRFGLGHHDRPLRAQAGEQHGRLHLSGGHRQDVVETC